MEDDYYSIESILAENQVRGYIAMGWDIVITSILLQKIQCTFKVDIPDMGHLDGGNERDVGPSFLLCLQIND